MFWKSVAGPPAIHKSLRLCAEHAEIAEKDRGKRLVTKGERARIAVGVSGSLGVVRRAMAVIEACFDEPVDVWAPAVLNPQRARLRPSRIVRRVFFAPSLYAPSLVRTENGARELTVPVYGDYDEVIPFHASPLANREPTNGE